ncbi:MAG TPA: class I SAM-dependent methyltransferase [Saprospiraceae bacterium]|nr:class I SAM-dependent methyltransferase [Saprospiraceae bacterium]HMQ81396.1 class I SAM-dependent methyltransferase [Saprospiraceae bacterium]
MFAKYDHIGQNYNCTRKADPYLSQRLLHHLQPRLDGIYLDIGCGTGNYTHALAQKGYRFIGIDPSIQMLEQARQLHQDIKWLEGRAESIPLNSSSIDGIIATLTIHHWADLEMGFRELHRVLKAGGRLIIFTSTPEQMAIYWLNYYFPKMLLDSMHQMPPLEQVTSALKSAGLAVLDTENYAVKKDLQDGFLYSGKYDAKRYLDPLFRIGISSFSSLANAAEVAIGLNQLALDVESGKFQAIQSTYEHDGGDYLFLIAGK